MNLGRPFEMNLVRSEILHRVASAICLLAVSLSCSMLSAQSIKAPEKRESSLKGNYYKAGVPDTLDLAERARLAVNAITGAADPHNNYEVFQCGHCDQQPANFNHNRASIRAAGPEGSLSDGSTAVHAYSECGAVTSSRRRTHQAEAAH